MKKAVRKKVYSMYGGRCAYTGTVLAKDWQVDHAFVTKYDTFFTFDNKKKKALDSIENYLPAQRVVNHYKRALDVEGFRRYMLDFSRRYNRLPKNPRTEKSKKTIQYMQSIANLFGVGNGVEFSGVFWFETEAGKGAKERS